MEEGGWRRRARAAAGQKSATHALTFGWTMSGLAGAVTGKDMRLLFREGTRRAVGHRRRTQVGRRPAAGAVAEIMRKILPPMRCLT